MIVLHILRLLEVNGFGTLNESLFYEELPIDGMGIAAISRGGGSIRRGRINIQDFDLYSRGENDLTSADALEKVWQFIADNDFFFCELPTVPGKSSKQYAKVDVIPMGNLENLGKDESNRKVYRWAYQVNYVKE